MNTNFTLCMSSRALGKFIDAFRWPEIPPPLTPIRRKLLFRRSIRRKYGGVRLTNVLVYVVRKIVCIRDAV